MYMRQFMQSLMVLLLFVPSVVMASDAMLDGNMSKDPVKKVSADSVRTITGTVYDAATNLPMSGVRVQATGHAKITTMTNATITPICT